MNIKKRGLGRGLDKLLSTTSTTLSEIAYSHDATAPTAATNHFRNLRLDMLQPGKYQPRRDMALNELEDLANSIRLQGVIQPIIVRPISRDRYEIIAGERRWRAAQLAALETIPALVRELDDQATLAISLIENLQREDLNPIEEAMGLQRLVDEFSLTHQQIADQVGKSRAQISNLIRLLGLPNEIKLMIENSDLEMGHARALLTLDRSDQLYCARTISKKGLSVREAEELARRTQTQPRQIFKPAENRDPDVRNLQLRLSETLGVSVTIQHSAKGKGKLVIRYNNLDELDGILEHIK